MENVKAPNDLRLSRCAEARSAEGAVGSKRRLGGVYPLPTNYQQHPSLRYPSPALAVSGKRVAPAQVGRQSDKDNIVQSMVAMP